MKRICILILTLLISVAICERNKYHLRSKKSHMKFSSDELLKNQNETPLLMDNIFEGKEVGISTHMAGDEIFFQKSEAIPETPRFKESSKANNNMSVSLRELENPTIVKSLNPNSFDNFNVRDRLALMTPQVVTNRQAYDVLYPTHQDYYKDRQMHVFDANFDKMEDYLVNNFKSAIDSSIDYTKNQNLVNVRDLDRRTLNVHQWNVAGNAPYVNKEALVPMKNSNHYKKNAKEMITDPYGAVVGY